MGTCTAGFAISPNQLLHHTMKSPANLPSITGKFADGEFHIALRYWVRRWGLVLSWK